MAKVIEGTKDRKQYQVLRGQKDTRQIRCPNKKCNNLVGQVADGRGGFHYKCSFCGTAFKHVSM